MHRRLPAVPVSCAYDALHAVPETGYFGTGLERSADALAHQRHRPGTISLCTLCAHRADGTTACVLSCPTAALTVAPGGPGPRVRLD